RAEAGDVGETALRRARSFRSAEVDEEIVGTVRRVAWHGSFSLSASVGRLLADAEDDELCRLDRGHADQADQAAVIEVVLGHRRPVAPDEERFFGLGAE